MSYGRMLQQEARLSEEIQGLLTRAGAVDEEEDARYGEHARGDELPAELERRERRLAAIQEAKERLEAAQREADDARGRKPGQDRNPKGGRPYKRDYGEPDPGAQSNFTDPESQIMNTSSEGFQQCYNAQTVVDETHQIIVATDVEANASDQGQLLPLLDEVSETVALSAKPRNLMAQFLDDEIAVANVGLAHGELGFMGGNLRLRRAHHGLQRGDIFGQRDHGGMVANETAFEKT